MNIEGTEGKPLEEIRKYHLLYDLCLKDYDSAQMLADFLFEMRLSIPHLTHLLD